jgi:hypothetical protein
MPAPFPTDGQQILRRLVKDVDLLKRTSATMNSVSADTGVVVETVYLSSPMVTEGATFYGDVEMSEEVSSTGQVGWDDEAILPDEQLWVVMPSAPLCSTATQAVSVTWDGRGAGFEAIPANFALIEIHRSTDEFFDADRAVTLVGVMTLPGSIVFTDQTYNTPYYYRFVLKTTDGRRSQQSETGIGIASTIGLVDLDDAAIDEIQQEAIDQAGLNAAEMDDLKQAETLATSKTYVDTQDSAGLAAAKSYTDSVVVTASGNTITMSLNNPSGTPKVGDLWYKTNGSGEIIGQWLGVAGSPNTWSQQTMNGQTVTNLNAGSITAGTLDAARIAADSITTVHLAANAVEADNIKAGAVIAGKLAANSVVAGNVAANVIRAREMILSDMSNMAEVNESTPVGTIWDGTHVIVSGWSTRTPTTSAYFMFRDNQGPVPVKTGDRIRLVFEGYADANVTVSPRLFLYGDASVNEMIGSSIPLTTTPTVFSRELTITMNTALKTTYMVGLDGCAGRNISVRNVRAYVMNAAELIVDGTISARHIAADTITGDKIAAGTITGDEILAGSLTIGHTAGLGSALGTKVTSFVQPSIPTSLVIGDLWVDTDDGNKVYRAASVGANEITAGEWVLQATASTTFAQPGIPTSLAVGDLWFDTDDNNKMYRAAAAGATTIGAGGWVLVTPVVTTTQTFAQASIPTAVNAGDLWIDTDDGNKMYRAAVAGANTISGTGWVAVYQAPGSTTYAQPAPPLAPVLGDLWVDTDDGNKMYRLSEVDPIATMSKSLWLKNDTLGTGTVTSWADSGPLARAVTKHGTGSGPTVVAAATPQGGKAVQTAVQDAFSVAGPEVGTGSNIEFWAVLKAGAQPSNGFWTFSAASNSSHYPYGGLVYETAGILARTSFTPTLAPQQWRVYRVQVNGTTQTIWLDNVQQAQATGVTRSNASQAYLGYSAPGNLWFEGQFAEIIILDHAATSQEVADLYNYLSKKHIVGGLGASGLGWSIVDNATVGLVKGWVYTNTTNINGGAIQTDTITAAQISAGAITAEKIAVGVLKRNLIADPSFEETYSLTNWDPFVTGQGNIAQWRDVVDGTTVGVTPQRDLYGQYARSGRGAMLLICAAGQTNSVISNTFPVVPGKEYRLSLFAASVTNPGTVYVDMQVGATPGDITGFDSATLTGDSSWVLNPPVTTLPIDPSAFTEYSWSFTPAGGKFFAALRLGNAAPPANSTVVLDDISVVETGVGGASELTSAGLRLFSAEGREVTAWMTNRASYFAVADMTGKQLASVSTAGNGSFSTMSVPGYDTDADGVADTGFEIFGEEFLTHLNKRPRGLAAYAYYNLGAGTWAITDVETPLFEFAFDGEPGREFWFHIDPMIFDITGSVDGRVGLVTRATTGGATQPTTASPLMRHAIVPIVAGLPSSVGLDITGQFSLYTRILVSAVIYTGATAGTVAANNNVIRAAMYDMGPKMDDGDNVFLLRHGGASPASKKTYTTTYTSTGWAMYQGGGSIPRKTNADDVKQGYSSYDGDARGLWVFPAMTGPIGATVTKVECYLYANHWYYNSGGTALIKTHNYAGPSGYPASNPTMTTAVSSANWPKPGGRWVDITAAAKAGVAAGTIKGIGVGPAGSSNLLYYGRFNGAGAKIRVTYVK